jgi:hypothetical protein
MVISSNSGETAIPINQGNCTGLVVTNGTSKNLYLFSSDGNTVNQQIALGGYYASNDGNTYTFNGQSIVAQFNDYAVIRLVQSSSPALAVSTGSLSNGTVGTAYSQTLIATGGTTPYTWSIISGSLPAGLSLSSSGVVSGTPTTAGGPTSVTFQVTDSVNATATKSLSITIAMPPTISTSSLPQGTVGLAYSQTLIATGGTSPYNWTVVTGSLPAGLTLSSSGLISGTPTAAVGPTSVTFKVTDINNLSATKVFSITTAYAPWDINMDGSVNVLDMTLVSQDFGQTGTPGWIREDVNGDGVINILDLVLVGQHWTG